MLIFFLPPAFAQYDILENGIYSEMKESRDKVSVATQPGAEGSGTPVFAADGVLGASLVSGGIFWGNCRYIFCSWQTRKICSNG